MASVMVIGCCCFLSKIQASWLVVELKSPSRGHMDLITWFMAAVEWFWLESRTGWVWSKSSLCKTTNYQCQVSAQELQSFSSSPFHLSPKSARYLWCFYTHKDTPIGNNSCTSSLRGALRPVCTGPRDVADVRLTRNLQYKGQFELSGSNTHVRPKPPRLKTPGESSGRNKDERGEGKHNCLHDHNPEKVNC